MGNTHYVGQPLLIKDRLLNEKPARCVYVENNWIVIRYQNKSDAPSPNSEQNALREEPDNVDSAAEDEQVKVFQDMERLHVVTDALRVSKVRLPARKEMNVGGDVGGGDGNGDEHNVFRAKEFYGMS